MPGGPLTGTNEKRIVDFSGHERFPLLRDSEKRRGRAFMSYAYDIVDQSGASLLRDRILQGAKPADLPVQQPLKFELITT